LTREDKLFLLWTVLAAVEMITNNISADELDEDTIRRRAEKIVRNFEKGKEE
jgi:hypothetical protein